MRESANTATDLCPNSVFHWSLSNDFFVVSSYLLCGPTLYESSFAETWRNDIQICCTFSYKDFWRFSFCNRIV